LPRLVLGVLRAVIALVWLTCTLVAVPATLLVLVGGLSPVQAPGLIAVAAGAGVVSILGALLKRASSAR
jgi:hypothetical protein